MTHSPGSDSTQVLLNRMQARDPESYGEILERHLPWIREQVRRRRRRYVGNTVESMDIVQDVALRVLRYGPKWSVRNPESWRRLLLRILCNRLKSLAIYERRRRALSLDFAHDDDAPVLDLEAGAAQGADAATASVKLDDRVEKAWMRLALELVDPKIAELIELRALRRMPYAEIGKLLGISADAARQRFDDALPKFISVVNRLKAGQLQRILDELDRLEREEGGGDDEAGGVVGTDPVS